MVATIGNTFQPGNLNPYHQKQADEQNRNNVGKTGQDESRTRETQQNSSSAPAKRAKESENDPEQDGFLKASSDNDSDDRSGGRTRGVNLDITV